MSHKNKAAVMIFIFFLFFFITVPKVLAYSFNIRDSELDITSCDNPYKDDSTISSFNWELLDDTDENVYPVIYLEIDAKGDWLGRGSTDNIEIIEKNIGFDAHDINVDITAQQTGDADDYCEGTFEAVLELKHEDFRASPEKRNFDINLHGIQWDGSTVRVGLEESERIRKDYRSIFIEHDGRWIELPNLGGYEPEWGLPYNCETGQCITEQLNEHTELLQYDLTEQEIWNFYWPPYETNTYNVVFEDEKCEYVVEKVENEYSGGDTDEDLRTKCPITEKQEEDYVYGGSGEADLEVHRVLRNLDDYDDIPFSEWSAVVDKHELEIGLNGAGRVTPKETRDRPHTFKGGDSLRDPDNVTVRATPEEGSSFEFWEGDCDYIDNHRCYVVMDQDRYVEANFQEADLSLDILNFEDGDTYNQGQDLNIEWEARNNFEDPLELEKAYLILDDEITTLEKEFDINEDVFNDYSETFSIEASEIEDLQPMYWNNLEVELLTQWEGYEFGYDSVRLQFEKEEEVEECIEMYQDVMDDSEIEKCDEVGYITCGDDHELPVYCKDNIEDLEDYDYTETGMPVDFQQMVLSSWEDTLFEIIMAHILSEVADMALDYIIDFVDEDLLDGQLSDIADEIPDEYLDFVRDYVSERAAQILQSAIENIIHDHPDEIEDLED